VRVEIKLALLAVVAELSARLAAIVANEVSRDLVVWLMRDHELMLMAEVHYFTRSHQGTRWMEVELALRAVVGIVDSTTSTPIADVRGVERGRVQVGLGGEGEGVLRVAAVNDGPRKLRNIALEEMDVEIIILSISPIDHVNQIEFNFRNIAVVSVVAAARPRVTILIIFLILVERMRPEALIPAFYPGQLAFLHHPYEQGP